MTRRSAYNAHLRRKNIPTIKSFCEDSGLEYEFVHGFEWHIRIEKVLDVFPTRKRWHWLPTGERGSFSDYDNLGQIFMEHKEDQ